MEPILHGRASAWCEENGLAEAAIDHALAARDIDRATALVEREAEATVMRSELATVRKWIRALPESVVRTRPLLCLYDVWALLVGGSTLDAAQARLQDAIKADDSGAFAGEVLAIRALIAAYQRKTVESVALSQGALDRLPEERTFFRSFVAGYLGMNHMYSGDFDAAQQAFQEAAHLAQEAGNVMNAVMASSHLAEIAAIRGQISGAWVLYERAIELAVNGDGRLLPVGGVPLIGLGRLSLLLNRLEEAQRFLDEGIELVGKWAEAGAIGGHIGRAQLQQARGDGTGARKAIDRAKELALRFDAMRVDDDYVAANKATLDIMQGDLEEAERWARQRELDGAFRLDIPSTPGGRSAVPLNLAYEYLTLGRLRLAQGRYDEALRILQSLRHVTDAAGWAVFGIRALVLESVALHAEGHTRQALHTLGRALALSEPERYTRVFLDEGACMAQLLYQSVSQGIVRGTAAEFAGKLMAAFEGSDAKPETAQASGVEPEPLVEPLSERELQVLALLAEGLTNREIAQRLHVALSTVKAHTYNMYGKLAVHSRTQAVAKARTLGLLTGS
jgi:LuxR family maltose regulon positive regulatory protein